MFCCKIRYKSLIQKWLTVGYRVHFARFCATFCCHSRPIGGETRPLRMQTDKLVCIVRFLGIILCKKAQKQPVRMGTSFRTGRVRDSCALDRLPRENYDIGENSIGFCSSSPLQNREGSGTRVCSLAGKSKNLGAPPASNFLLGFESFRLHCLASY